MVLVPRIADVAGAVLLIQEHYDDTLLLNNPVVGVVPGLSIDLAPAVVNVRNGHELFEAWPNVIVDDDGFSVVSTVLKVVLAASWALVDGFALK